MTRSRFTINAEWIGSRGLVNHFGTWWFESALPPSRARERRGAPAMPTTVG